MISLSKGSAPRSDRSSPEAPNDGAGWRIRRRLGGGMRQAGLLAAAGLYALQNNFDRLQEDHRRARRLADGIGEIETLAPAPTETNIVMVELLHPGLGPDRLLAGLADRGVRITAFGPRRLRAVTHLDVDDHGIDYAIRSFREVVLALIAGS
jgi:threonine aldolase